MKCPKCGFNSFEFLDNCRKCGTDLVAFKGNHGINPIVFPGDAPTAWTSPASTTGFPADEVPLSASRTAASNDDTEGTFTWDIPALNETAPETETAFSGFELDFMKEDPKQEEPQTGFTFSEEPPAGVTGIPLDETGESPGDFSFYEETLDPVGTTLFSGSGKESPEPEDDPFGDTGVMYEITPERLDEQAFEPVSAGGVDNFSPEPEDSESELLLEEVSEEGEDVTKERLLQNIADYNCRRDETPEIATEAAQEQKEKTDPIDFSDFEKDFESLFTRD